MTNKKVFGAIAAALLAGALMAMPAAAQQNGGGGGGGGAPAASGGGGSGGGMRSGPAGNSGARKTGRRPGRSNFAGRSGRGHGGYQGHYHGQRAYGPTFGLWGLPFAYDYGWGYPDEPDCYLRRVRVHHHWVWRQYCD